MNGRLKLIFFLFFTFSFNSIAQNLYSGTVIDENSEPIFGASIIVKKNSNFVQTDIDGNFLVEAEINDILLISYSGFKNLELQLSNDYELNNIILKEDIKLLDEVIVIGYGNQRKEILTSSVSSVKGDDLTNEPVLNVTQALQGKAAGVQIISSDAPGVASQVIIRGLGTIQAGREPLYVVDGILTNNINNINTADIETISILKDAASLAIYGNRGANGVIIVNTKKGGEEEIKVSYDNFIGIRDINYRPVMANSNSFVTYSNEAILFNLLNDSNPNNDNDLSAFFPSDQLYNTNWLNEISQLAFQSNHNISASGGNENLKTFFSVGLNQEEGILKGSELERATLRSNLNYKISEKIKYSHNISFQLANSQPKSFGVFTTAYKQAPIVPVRDENGRYGSSVAFNNVGNPVAQLDLQNEKQRFLKLQGAFKIDYEIIDNLNFTSRFSVETNHNRFYNFDNRLETYLSLEPGNTIDNFQPTDPEAEQIPETVLYVAHSNDYRWFFDNYVTYKKTINDSHNIDVTLGLVAEENKYETLYGSRINVPADENLNFNLDLGNNNDGTEGSGGGFSETRKLYSYISRLNYDFDKKYLFNISFRQDASNFFQEKYRYGNFYALSAGWYLSKESFMDESIFDILKARISYGKLGNAQIPSLNIVRYNQGFSYPFGTNQDVQQGGTVTATVQEDLSWESTYEFNFGIEFALLDYKLNGEIDIYERINSNAILPLQLPNTFGFDPFLSHVGEIKNVGVELSLDWNESINDDLSYSINTNLSYNKNELSKISNQFFTNQTGGNINNGQYTKRVSIGQPLGSFYLYEIAGIDDRGEFVYKDLNNDGEINENDRRFFGSYIPSLVSSFNLKVVYKNFDFNIATYGSFGNKVYNGKKAQRFGNENIEQFVFNNRWTSGRPSTNTPVASNNVPLSSNYFLESGDYFRINNFTIGYTFEREKSKLFNNTRLYFTAKNPLILKRFSGYTPELPGDPMGLAGIELDAYPTLSSYYLGINMSF